jgi:hypothetical protein
MTTLSIESRLIESGFRPVELVGQEGLWPVQQNGKSFHVNEHGRPVYTERFDFVWSFSEGKARVKKDGEMFHITPNGKPAYKGRFSFISDFHKGFATIRTGWTISARINHSGTIEPWS